MKTPDQEEKQKKCEELIRKYKEQLDEYIASRENLCFVEFITFGTNLTKSRLEFARILSKRFGEYLSGGNILEGNNLSILLTVMDKTIEENNRKTGEFLLIANPGKLQNIMESAWEELSNYCTEIRPNVALRPFSRSKVIEGKTQSSVDVLRSSKRKKYQSKKVAKTKVKQPHPSRKRRIMSIAK